MKHHFPFFTANPSVTYLDSAATTQRLQHVIDSNQRFLATDNATVHRAAYRKATLATETYESSRAVLAKLINANSDEIVFTSGATESINMIADGLSTSNLVGTKILVCASEHHANLLPWQKLAKRLDLSIEVLPLSENGTFSPTTFEQWVKLIDEDVCLIACAHVSNVLGNIYPIKQLCLLANKYNAITVIDGTQAVAHLSVDMTDLNCDFYVFSGHKMYGPTGVGILFGKYHQLATMQVSKLGGEMVSNVSYQTFTAQPPPLKFEAGTPNITGVIGIKHAALFLMENFHQIISHERRLSQYLLQQLRKVNDLRILGNIGLSSVLNESAQINTNENIEAPEGNIGIVSFIHESADNHSLVEQLWHQDIALRYGHHCAMPLLSSLALGACLRISLGAYSDKTDIDRFISALLHSLGDIKNNDKKSLLLKNEMQERSSNEKALIDDIIQASDWSTKHRALLLLSKCLKTLPQEERNELSAIDGCEAAVWLRFNVEHGWRAYSDSKVIRGILALLLYVTKAGNKVNYSNYLEELGLSSYFSVGRRDGVNKIISRLQSAL